MLGWTYKTIYDIIHLGFDYIICPSTVGFVGNAWSCLEKNMGKNFEKWESHGFVGKQHGILLFFEKPLFKKLDVDGTWMGSLILGINMNIIVLQLWLAWFTSFGCDMFHQSVAGVFFHPMEIPIHGSCTWRNRPDGQMVISEQWHGHGY